MLKSYISETSKERSCNSCDKVEFVYHLGGSSYVDSNENPRTQTRCNACIVHSKIKSTPIYINNCPGCEAVFVAKTKVQKYCTTSCCKDTHNATRKKPPVKNSCPQCNIIHSNPKYCSDSCRRESRLAKEKNRSCKSCGKKFSAKGVVAYCSDECRTPPNVCNKCSVPVDPKRRLCDDCSTVWKPELHKKSCKTCNTEFNTTKSQQVYCSKECDRGRAERRNLRKRQVRQAKLSCEKWSDIAEFKKNRPKGHQLDHIIPLNHPDVCGLHNTWNFQWLTKSDNIKKNNSFDGTEDNNSWKELS